MKNFFVFIVFALFVFVTTAQSKTIASPPYFPFNIHSKWKYKSNLGVVNVTIKATDNPKIFKRIFKGLASYTEFYSWDNKGIYCLKKEMRHKTYKYFPKTLSYQYPLTNGKTWEYSGTETSGKKTVYSYLKAYVEGDETIIVPAGKFLCKKIRFEYHDTKGTEFIYHQWLNKDVGMIQTLGKIKGKGVFGVFARLGGGKFMYKLMKYTIK